MSQAHTFTWCADCSDNDNIPYEQSVVDRCALRERTSQPFATSYNRIGEIYTDEGSAPLIRST